MSKHLPFVDGLEPTPADPVKDISSQPPPEDEPPADEPPAVPANDQS